ncbi:lissencephaly-1 homolog [Clupea harengus]|uniref:Lissencephaly-1 homolog n=1 Tax=Clupea harengus TaxID=7950 RepID=A0A6P3VNU3_CLUHA|nr:lissencephaly-1 homolog [Clupea harengus]
MGEVRKLHKKLRQIENLEIKASLTTEERVKVSKKVELRARLAELLLQLSGPQQTQSIVGDESEKMKRQVVDSPEVPPAQSPAPKMPRAAAPETGRGQAEEESEEEPASPDIPASTETSSRQQQESEFSSLKASWEATKFRLRTLEGHSDIITCVVAVDNLVISGSRDTTVKVWHVPTATEQRNLGGHTGGVTALCAPPPEYCRKMARFLDLSEKERFILSGAGDCCVRIWVLSSGQCVKSIYTFNAVTALCFIPEGHGYIITGSDAGKVQAWSWQSMENCQSVNAHEEAVTALQSQGPLVFSGSADGSLCVWEVHPSHRNPLQRLQQWGPSVTGCGGTQAGRGGSHRGHLALSPRGDRVFMASGKASVRVLNWRTGTVSRLTNHSSTAGVTDCINQIPGLLIGSCFDLATGESTLNLFTLPHCRYLVSLISPEAPRILCFSTWCTSSGDHRWVTGGRELTVWEQLPSKTKQKGDVAVKRDIRLDSSLMESEEDSDGEVDGDSDDYSEEDSTPQDAPDTEGVANSSWLRCILQ